MTAIIFFRHLWTSIKRRPLQPVLLIFVIMLAVSVCIASSDAEFYMKENEDAVRVASNGKADYKVTVNSFSPTRFILLQEGDNNIPEGVDVCGVYALPLTFGEENNFVYGVACDFEDANTFFDLEFTEYLPVLDTERDESIFVSQEFSQKYGIKVGEMLHFTLLGRGVDFTVHGISEKEFLGQYDVMFHIISAGMLLSDDSVYLKSFFEEGRVTPAGTVFIRSNGKWSQAEIQNAFSGMTVSNIAETANNTYNSFGITMTIMKIMTLVFTVVVIYCCFHILSMQRQEEIYLFSCIGAKRYLLNLISSLEMTFYFLIGGGLGIALSLGMGQYIIYEGNLIYCRLSLHGQSIGIALLLTFLSVQSSLALYLMADFLKGKKKDVKVSTLQRERNQIISTAVCILTSIVFAVVAIVLNPLKKVPYGVITAVLTLFSAFLLAKNGLKWVSFIPWKKKSPIFSYAVKNIGQVGTLGNMSGLLSIFLVMIFAFTILLSVCINGIKMNENLIAGDYLVFNASEEARDILEKTSGVKKVTSLYKEYIQVGDTKVMLISSDKRETFLSSFDMEDLPTGNQAYFAKVFAEKQGFELGQMVTLTIGEKKIDVHYTKAVETTTLSIVIDAEYWNIPMNYLVVTAESSVQKNVIYNRIVTALVGQSATVLDKAEFTAEWVKITQNYLLCLKILYVFTVFFSVVGLGDSLFASYRSRREEFSFYKAAGMSREMIGKLKMFEILCVIGIAILVFLLQAGLMFVAVSEVAGARNTYPIWLWREVADI